MLAKLIAPAINRYAFSPMVTPMFSDVCKVEEEWVVINPYYSRLRARDYQRAGSFVCHPFFPEKIGVWAVTRERFDLEIKYIGILHPGGRNGPTPSGISRLRAELAREIHQREMSAGYESLFVHAIGNPPSYKAVQIYWAGYIHNTFAAISALGVLIGILKAIENTWNCIRERARNKIGCCKSCGYSLVGLEKDSPCPECGKSIPASKP